MTIVGDVERAADWIATALQSSGYGADFTPQSLWEIERFFDEHVEVGQPVPGGLLSEDLGQRLFAVGSYVGEVIRRECGGQWSGDDADPQAEINVAVRFPDESIIWPVQRVMKRYASGGEESIAAYGMALGVDVGHPPKLETDSKDKDAQRYSGPAESASVSLGASPAYDFAESARPTPGRWRFWRRKRR